MPQTTDQLKAAIMNLPCDVPAGYPYGSALCAGVYRHGHRDARHAAAELVSAVPLVAEAPREPPLPEGWATEALEAIWNAPIGTTITADMKRAASLALRVARGERWDDDSCEWVAPPVSLAPMPEPTDEQIHALWVKHVGTHTSNIAFARAVLASVAPQPEQPNTDSVHLADNGRTPVQGLDAEGRDAVLLDWLDAQWCNGVHVEVCATGGPTVHGLRPVATVYAGQQRSDADSVREAIRAAMTSTTAKE